MRLGVGKFLGSEAPMNDVLSEMTCSYFISHFRLLMVLFSSPPLALNLIDKGGISQSAYQYV